MRMNTDMAKKILEQNTVPIPVAVEDGVCFMVREQEALDAISAALEAALPHLAAPEAGNPVSAEGTWQHEVDCIANNLGEALEGCDDRASAVAAITPYIDEMFALAVRQPVNESPMAKMAAALRGKAEAERAAFDQRVQSGEWGPMPDNPDVLELPPLPEEVDSVRCMIRGEKAFAEPCDYYFTSKQMRDYARTALAASQPKELIAQKVGDHHVTVAEDCITVSRGRDIVFAYCAGDMEPINARQPVEPSVEEDVYCAIADMIEPYVQREGINPNGELPASVHDSVAILLDHWTKTRQPEGEV